MLRAEAVSNLKVIGILMKDEKIVASLQEILEWAKGKTHEGSEPPWAWYQYMKIIEAIESILKGMRSVNPKENLQQFPLMKDIDLQLVDRTDPLNIAPHRPAETDPQMPM